MAKPKKGVIPPHLRKYLFKKRGSTRTIKRSVKMAKRRGSRGGFSLGNAKNMAKGLMVGYALTALTNDNKIGAVGGFLLGGVTGAVGGFFAPQISGLVGGMTGGSSTSTGGF